MLICPSFLAQGWQDPAQKAADELRDATSDRIAVHVEERTRWEEKYGVTFGKTVNQQDMLSRVRIGMQYAPVTWLTFSGMGQDARAPFYGMPAPNTMRDPMDLQEGRSASLQAAACSITVKLASSPLRSGATPRAPSILGACGITPGT
jgi:hypothetical protein